MRLFVCLLLSFAEIWDTEGQANMYLSRPVRIEDFPYMASVFVNDQFVGAAVIISREFALGNMHYFFGAYSYDVHLRVGHTNRDEGEKVEVKDFFQHEEFQFSADYDICLIQFLEKVKFGPKVGAINLSLLPPPAGLRGEVLSWGPVVAKGTTELHAVMMATMTSAQCQATATESVTDRLTCISNPTVHLCEEDLGAPFVVDGKLMGQYVGGFPTCQPQNVLFSKISQYKDYLVLLVDMARHPKSYEPISHMSEEQIET